MLYYVQISYILHSVWHSVLYASTIFVRLWLHVIINSFWRKRNKHVVILAWIISPLVQFPFERHMPFTHAGFNLPFQLLFDVLNFQQMPKNTFAFTRVCRSISQFNERLFVSLRMPNLICVSDSVNFPKADLTNFLNCCRMCSTNSRKRALLVLE